ncbi:restriction endonuclease subunit S [Streptococcus hyovaginalis]
MKTNNNIPAYRFQGYTDAWELRKLGEVAEMYSGGTPSVGKKEFYEGNIPFIRSAEINSHNTELFLSELGLSNSSAKMVNKGDLLYALYGATSGEVGLAKISGAINQAILAIIPSIGYSSSFLLQWLKREKNNIIEKYLQGGQGNLSGAIVKDFFILFPTLPEQEAIGTFFSTLDRQITLHQRKLDTLKEQKKTYLKLLFPAKGQTKPALRFQGFEDDWEEVKLGEIADVFDGTHQTPKYTNHGVMFLSVEDIATLKSEKYISLEDFEKEFKIFPEFNDVLMTRIGDIGTSNIVKTNEKIAYYVSLALIKPRKLESHFLNSIIQSKDFQNELWKRTLHIAFPKKINKGEISEVNLKFPTLPEQEAIGTFFHTLDQEITQVEDKLASLKEMKKTLLRKLFV